MSKRQDILNNIQTTLEAVSSLNTVIMYQPTSVSLDTIYLPCAFVFTLSESESGLTSGLVGQETWEWILGIEVWFKNETTNEETILKAVNDALYVDGQRGGCAVDTKRISIDHFEVNNDRENSIKGFAMTIRILYYHSYGVM
jgi:hypothetical protein